MHPDHSFKRVLYAHLRGRDRRKPFSQVVEKALLKCLREDQPWKRVFGKASRVGIHGFAGKGFHEKISATQKDAFSIRASTPYESSHLEAQEISEPSTSTKSDQVDQVYNQLGPYFLQTICLSKSRVVERRTPWELLLHTFDTWVPIRLRLPALKAAAELGIVLYSPAVYYHMKQIPSPSDIRFHPDFVWPPPEQRVFEEDRPVGNMILSTAWIVLKQDQAAVDLYGGCCVGMSLAQLCASIFHFLYSCIRHHYYLHKTGIGWVRGLYRRLDGTTGVLVAKTILVEDHFLASVQDQSHKFPAVLKLPNLI